MGNKDRTGSSTLAAREAAVLARERAADQRERIVEQREARLQAATQHRARSETYLLEANENLVAAAVHSQTMTEVAELATKEMSIRAEHDFLTGLPNRALLTDRVAQAIELAKRHRDKVALMFLDLDAFKEINDSLGHSVGDQLLQSAAQRLVACVRHSDTVSRYGGDEFIVLLSDVKEARDAIYTAEKLIKAMAQPHLLGDHRLQTSVSIGISLYPEDGDDVQALIANADTAMYVAKRSGRNTFRRFTSGMNSY